MISFTVRLTFEEGDREAIARLLRSLTPASRQEPGCVNYLAHFVEGEPLTVLIYEQYTDEAALELPSQLAALHAIRRRRTLQAETHAATGAPCIA